jgi:hypothetical protein
MAKSTRSAKTTRARAPARKPKRAAAPAKRPQLLAANAMVGHPDLRYPVYGDPTHEILCKWIDAWNEYHCEKVPVGGDFPV